MDFTLEIYTSLIKSLQNSRYNFTRFDDYKSSLGTVLDNYILIRHDVDRHPENTLRMAQLEADIGICGTYYFRIVPDSFDERIIAEIAELGHEIGYHYEDVDLAVKRQTANGKRQWSEVSGQRSELRSQRSEIRGRKSESGIRIGEPGCRSIGDMGNVEDMENQEPVTWNPAPGNRQPTTDLIDRAMESFLKNLETMRKIVDIKTICMHGSPLSPYDNRLLWTRYDYRDYGIIGEPYFDVDFSKVAYYTDTGRRWDGDAVSVRDKVIPVQRSFDVGEIQRSEVRGQRSNVSHPEPETRNMEPTTGNRFPGFRTTHEMIKAIEDGRFPEKAMITIHPQRWTNEPVLWIKELVGQSIKNIAKVGLNKYRSLKV